MAKFKVNDLITDGNVTIWITGVTDTHYIFTEQSFDKFSRPIGAIDANFRLYEPKKIWHKPSEEPIDNKEVLIAYGFDWNGNQWHDVGYYRKDSNEVQIDIETYIEMARVLRWAYLSDLEQL